MSSTASTLSAATSRPGVFRFKTAFIIVALTFVICLLIALDLVHQNAVNVPFMDEWDFLEWTTGEFPITWSWLWLPHNEHRMPLMRLMTIGILRASGHDFRVGCYVVVAILAIISLLLLLLIRRIRGHFVWTDAIFPLVMLHLGHCENLLWSFQLQFAASALAPCVLLMLVLTDLNSRWQVPATLVAFAVSLCGFGAAALAYAPFLPCGSVFWGGSVFAVPICHAEESDWVGSVCRSGY